METRSGTFTKLFYGWDVRPGRDQAWYDARKKEYDDISLFEKEYPASEEEALAPPRTLAAFNREALNDLKKRCMEPISVIEVGGAAALTTANIYKQCVPGQKYTAATDTSHGTGNDYSVTVVFDSTTESVVADIMDSRLGPSDLAIASVDLLELYGNPIWGIEDNDWGIQTLSVAQDLKYPRLFARDEGKFGWHTYDTASLRTRGSRFTLWSDLIDLVANRAITVFSQRGLSQFYEVIKNPDKKGRIEAQLRANDDYPLTVGIAVQIRQHATRARGLSGRIMNRYDKYIEMGPDREPEAVGTTRTRTNIFGW